MMRVGVTGHQRLGDPEAWSWVGAVIQEELEKIPPPVIGVTSLAIGADQLLARVVLDVGGTIHAVLPFADIERSFSPEDVPAYRKLVRQATVEVLNIRGTEEDAYLAAGKRVVDLSDIVLAVWNGQHARGKGGTADIVAYAIKRSVPVIHINPVDRSVTRQ
jgi:hypothetical protein